MSSARIIRFPVSARREAPAESRGLLAALVGFFERRAAIRYLSHLDDHLLADLGIRRSEIRAVVNGR